MAQPSLELVWTLPGTLCRGAFVQKDPEEEREGVRLQRRITERLGPDPLRADWDAGEAARRLAADPRRPLAAALLDQQQLAGLGTCG